MKLIFCAPLFMISCIGTKKSLNESNDIFLNKDSITYCQTRSPWVSNCYTFYYETPDTSRGRFRKNMESDDGQFWHGNGSFYRNQDTIFLSSFILYRNLNNKQQDSDTIAATKLIQQKKILIQKSSNDSSKTIFTSSFPATSPNR